MPRSVDLYLADIQKAISRIESLMNVLDEQSFKSGAVETDGILFNLMTIGESAKNVPQEIRDIMPEIAWSDIGRFRDFVVHHYFSIDMERVWSIVHTDLPELSRQVSALQKRLEDKNSGEK